MRTLLALLFTGAVLSGCGGGGGGSSPSVLPPLSNVAPPIRLETPISASAFNDSIGVNLHMTYVVGAYNTDFSLWAPLLERSGIKHVRDGVCPTFVALAWCENTLAPRMNELASNGIKFDLVTAMSDPFSYVTSYAATLAVTPAIEAYEGPNECDASGLCPSNWMSTEPGWQQEVYSMKTPGVTIVAPSMTSAAGYADLGNLAPYADFGNIHDYVGSDMPESSTAAALHLQWAQAMTGSDPVWSTEDGYNTDPTFANNGVPQVVQERYLPRMLLEHMRLGINRTYIYQLFDFGPDGGSNMGLLNADYTAKPAWTALMQLMKLFADNGPAPRTPLSLSVTGDKSGTLDHVLFQRSDGTYMLALWLAQPAYDPNAHTVLPIASETLTVGLPPTTATATLTAFQDNGSISTIALTGKIGSFQVPVESVVSVLEFDP